MFDYPVFEMPVIGLRLLMAIDAITHVYMSHGGAAGGSIVLVIAAYYAHRKNDQKLYNLIRRILMVFFMATTAVGALTGIGIWIHANIINPNGIGSLIRFFGAVLVVAAGRWNRPEDEEIRKIAVDQGKKWIIMTTPLNIVILPLILFAYSPRTAENFISGPFVILPFISAATLFVLVLYLIKEFSSSTISPKSAYAVSGAILTVIVLMSTARQGLRVASFAEPMQLQAEETRKYMENSLAAYHEFKAKEKNRPAMETDARYALAQEKGCLACHSIEMQLVGPAYKEVAARYSSPDQIIPSILSGSSGKRGHNVMPKNNVTEKEASILAAWILEQK